MGLATFGEAVRAQGATAVDIDWRPPKPGTFVRDLFQVSCMLDKYGALGRPIFLTAAEERDRVLEGLAELDTTARRACRSPFIRCSADEQRQSQRRLRGRDASEQPSLGTAGAALRRVDRRDARLDPGQRSRSARFGRVRRRTSARERSTTPGGADLSTTWRDDKFHDECGLFGVWNHAEAANVTYLGLYSLQHRGQESAGIAVSDQGRVTAMRDMGLVSQVFDERKLQGLQGEIAIGHTRYSTTGSSTLDNAQPVVARVRGSHLSLAHNGHSQLSDSNTGEREGWMHNGLSELGRKAIAEMNRLGMLVDVSHVSDKTMSDVLDISTAPVIASHSSARALGDRPHARPPLRLLVQPQ